MRAALVRTIQDRLADSGPLPNGPFDVIVVDPPWPYDSDRLPYPTMSLEAISSLPVGSLLAPDGILFLWTTNAFVGEAYGCLSAWSLQPKTLLTWVKHRSTFGSWLLNQSEHAILAVRGKPSVLLTNESTVLSAPVREHSVKPPEFYTLVEKLCPGRRLDLFARRAREGWTTWGSELGSKSSVE